MRRNCTKGRDKIGKLPLHLRSGTRNYRGKNAAELYYLSKAQEAQKQEIRRNAFQRNGRH
jgi:hypothetical protein